MFGDDVLTFADAAHADASAAQLRLFDAIAEIDRREVWRGEGARDTAHLLSMRYGISMWKAHRWTAAARTLERLPRLAHALGSGRLHVDKVVELARFATPESETDLICWAEVVSCATVRQRADREVARRHEEDLHAQRSRFLHWWWTDEGRRLGLEAELPATEGAVVVRAIERLASRIPAMPDEDDPVFVPARRADALVAMAHARIAGDPDPDRATVVVHAQLGGLVAETHGCELEGGPAISPAAVNRLLCTSRMQTVLEDPHGRVQRLSETARVVPAWMLRQVRYRDRGCRFPGCGTNAFTEAHHVTFRRHGGRTTLANMVLICSFHHRLLHEHRWSMERSSRGNVRWFRPDGTPHAREGPLPLERTA